MPRRPNIINTEYNKDCSDKMIVESEKMPAKEGAEVNGVNVSNLQTELMDDMGGPQSGGRRKKARPTRVFLDSESEFAEAATPAMDTDEGIGVDSPDMDREALSGMESKASDTDIMMEVEVAIACDLCNHSFASQSLLTAHIESAHKIQDGKEAAVFPTKYHQLGKELQQELGVKEDEEAGSRQVSSATTGPPAQDTLNNGDSHNSYDSSTNKAKIFHHDAFCDLCNREFCNKYFLKTHKANKHGIYEAPEENDNMAGNSNENGVPPALLPLPQATAGVGGVIFPGDETGQQANRPGVFDGASSSRSFSSVASSLPTMIHVPLSQSSGMSMLTSDDSAPKPIVIEPKPIEDSAVTNTATPVTPSKTITSSSGKTVPPDMEDYCEICQKHFCNKYYLKKHKHDVHGIVPEPSPGKRGGRSSQGASGGISISSGSCTLPTSIITTSSNNFGFNNPLVSSAPLIMPPMPTSLSTGAMNGTLPGMTAGAMANLMFINPFAPPVAFIQAQPTLQGNAPTAFTPQQLAIPQLPPLPALPTADSPKMGLMSSSSSSSSSPSSLPLPKDALRSMGVLNADAYCELCRKEFCNRYFLRIHKANKHGIYTDDLLLPPPPMGLGMGPILQVPSVPTSMDHLYIQGVSPTGLSDAVKTEKTEAGEKASPAEEKTKAERDANIETCDVCKKEFGNLFSLRVHMLNAHNVKPKDMDFGLDVPDPSKLDLFFNNAGMQGTMFSNMIAAKLADRVSCDICHKEVCNKYFLRTHKMKVHGIDPAAFEVEQREKSSPVQLSLPTTTEQSEGQAAKTEEVSPSHEALRRPRDDELLKMGIDPEAYCEICKKEFCSKYFLKTHKLNIHGMKGDAESTATVSSSIPLIGPQFTLAPTAPILTPALMPPITSVAPAPDASLASQMASPIGAAQMASSIGAVQMASSLGATHMASSLGAAHMASSLGSPLASLGPALMTSPLTSPLRPVQMSLGNMAKGGKGERSTWKWKEPVNSTRVMCSICNKEVCNKYFLKTHMLKRHGLNYDVTTGIASAPSSIPGIPDHLLVKPPSKPTAPTTPAVPQMQGLDLTKADANQTKQDTEKPTAEVANVAEKNEKDQVGANKLPGTVLAKTWCVPAEGKKTANGQSIAMVAKECVATVMATPTSSEGAAVAGFSGDLYIQKCELCGMIFGEKVTLQLHMIRDHQAQVIVQAGSPAGSPAPVHNGLDSRSSSTCNIGRSLRKKYQSLKPRTRNTHLRRLGSGIAGIGEKVKSAIVNHIRNHQRHNHHGKRFRCAHCQEKFLSRVQCQSHIKAEHAHLRAAAITEAITQPEPPSLEASTNSHAEDKAKVTKKSRQSTRTSGYATRSSKLNHSNATSPSATAAPLSQAATPPRNGKTQIPVGYATPSDTSPSAGIVMQSFTLQEKDVDDDSCHFATSVVHLPVFERIAQPTAVTFMLTPMEQ